MKTPHRVRTLVRLTEDQHDWLVNTGRWWHEEMIGQGEPSPFLRHDGEINISEVIRSLLSLASTELPAHLAYPFPPD